MASPLFAIAKRQWRSYFNSPVAYVFIVLALVAIGLFTWTFGRFYEARQADLYPFFFFIPWIFAILVPLLCMGLWSEERRTKTVEVLLTLPVKSSQAIIGKFLAAWALLGVVIFFTLPMVFTTFWLGDPDKGRIIGGYLGFFLLCGAFAAIGLFCSTLSRSPVVSFIIAALVCIISVLIGFSGITEFLYAFLPAKIVSGIASTSTFTNFMAMQSGNVSLFNLLFFVCVIIFFLALAILNTREPSETGLGGSGWLFALLFVGVLIALNVIVSALGIRADLTEDKLYTLTEGTSGVLENLEKPVTLKYYFSRGAKDVAQPLKDYGKRVGDLLKQYDKIGGKNVVLETFNPKPFTEEEEWAQKFGLASAADPRNPSVDPFFCGLVVQSGTKEEVIPFFQPPAPGAPETVEYDVTKLVTEVARTKPPKVGILSSLQVFGGMAPPQQNPFGGPPQPQELPKWQFIGVLESFYDVEELKADAFEIPEDLTTLILIHPKNLSEDVLYSIDQFVMGGGNVVAFLDPYCYTESAGQQTPMAMIGSGGSDINGLSSAWGVTFNPDRFVGDPESYSTRYQPNLGIMEIDNDTFADNVNALTGIRGLTLFWGGAFEVDESKQQDGMEVTTLFTSSKEAGLLESMRAMGALKDQSKNLKAEEKEIPLAVRITGTIPSAFPARATNETHKAEGSGSLVMMGDVDPMGDNFAFQFINMFGQRAAMPTGTLALPMGLIAEGTGNTALMSLQNRGNFNRRLTRVDEIERAASKETQAQMQSIQDEIDKANEELAKIKPPEGENSTLFLNKELKTKQAEINVKIRQAQKEIKEAEKESLKGVRSLGTLLKFGNIMGMAAIVALLGLFRFWVRNNRSRPKRA